MLRENISHLRKKIVQLIFYSLVSKVLSLSVKQCEVNFTAFTSASSETQGRADCYSARCDVSGGAMFSGESLRQERERGVLSTSCPWVSDDGFFCRKCNAKAER